MFLTNLISMSEKYRILFGFLLFVGMISNVVKNVAALREEEEAPAGFEWDTLRTLVKRGERKSVISTEYGEVTSVRVGEGVSSSYHLQFITLEPNSLFLPVVLHADMVFYVHTGSGRLTWMDEDEQKSVDLRIGDVFRLPSGTIFFLESNLEAGERQKLRLYSIFANSRDDLREPKTPPYSRICDMVLGFGRKVLQVAFQVPEEVIEEVLNGTNVPAIVHGVPKSTKKTLLEMEAKFMKGILGRGGYGLFETPSNKKKNPKLFNVFKEKPDFENCNGWSTVITKKKLGALKGSDIGIYVVNLTKGSMMGPHWNPMATEIGIALQGSGMVRVVCSSTRESRECKNQRFRVEEGDVFAVPRFHPMAQMAFNNNSFVFVGFSTTSKKHHPQYLAGKASVLRTLDREILAASFNATNTTMDRLLGAQGDSVILECTSCAEEEERVMAEEIRREEEARRREEEAQKEREEERRRQEEEAARRRREEEEARRKEEEEAARRGEEEAEREREAEKARRRHQEEEEERRREEAAKSREEEQAQREAEEARRREEAAARRREEEEEEAEREREAEEARRRHQEEEEGRRREEEAAKRTEEQAQREAEKARRREEEEGRHEEEAAEERRQEEAGRQEEAAAKQEEKRKGRYEAEGTEIEETREDERGPYEGRRRTILLLSTA